MLLPFRRARGAVARAVVASVLPLVVPPSPARAQLPPALPAHEALNPALVSRTGLLVLPVQPRRDGLAYAVGLEYGSVVERNIAWPDTYLLDAELLRLRLQLRRELGGRFFLQAEGGVTGSYAGFADGFFERYHALIDFTMEERDARPRNDYGDRLTLEAHDVVRERPARPVAPSDARLTLGARVGRHAQTALTMTVPLAPSSSPFARGTVTVGLLQALRAPIGDRLRVEATGGIGYSPRQGVLSDVQRTVHTVGSIAADVRLWGGHSVYGTFFRHGAPYRGTRFPELDEAELGADFGYQWSARSGRVWRVGLTEDVQRRDPGIDLVLKLSVSH